MAKVGGSIGSDFQWCFCSKVAQRVRNRCVLQSSDRDDVARAALLRRANTLQPAERQQLGDASLFNIPGITRGQCLDCRIRPNFARLDPPGSGHARDRDRHQNCREKLEFIGILNGRRWHIVDDEIAAARHIRLQTFRRFRSPATFARGKQHRKVELVLAGIKCRKEIESFVAAASCDLASGLSTLLIKTIGRRPRPSALPTTNLVCGIGPSAASTNTTTPSTILRIRSTSPPKSACPGVSTIFMTRIAPLYRCALWRFNATFAFLVIAIHCTLRDTLVIANETTLPQQTVDKRRLPMIDMGDDRDVSYVHLARRISAVLIINAHHIQAAAGNKPQPCPIVRASLP